MKTTIHILALGLGLSQLGYALPTLDVDLAPRAACATGLHMIVARASTEAAGEGLIGGVASAVKLRVSGSDSESVDYPATLTDYVNSESKGITAMTKLIKDYTTRCPNTMIALLGYSQGAQVVGDVLCGRSSSGSPTTTPLPTEYAKNIVAIVQMGDPSHVVGLAGNVGSSKKAGLFPRKNTAACAPYGSKTQSYCDTGDQFCDSGYNMFTHLSYAIYYTTAAADFIVSKAT